MRAVASAISPDDTPSSPPESAMPQGAEIVVAGLAKDFAGVSVLHGVDLRIPAGQFLAVVGRSGSGKTTLLRLICGLDAPSAGSIAIGGVAGPATVTTRIMFQEPRLLPWAKVIGNVEVGLGGASGPEARQRALRALQEVGLATRAGDWPAVLSGGQKQRVALARALVGRPQILAFDEPLGALDALTRIEMQSLIETIWRDQGFTAVLVTHDVGEALALADRIVLIDHGAIALDLAVDLPRPRRRGSAEVAALEGIVLGALFGESRSERATPVV